MHIATKMMQHFCKIDDTKIFALYKLHAPVNWAMPIACQYYMTLFSSSFMINEYLPNILLIRPNILDKTSWDII